MLPEDIPVYVVVGADPDTPAKALEIFMEPERAAGYVLDGLVQALFLHRQGRVRPGEQISLIVTIGDSDKDTSGSVVVMADDHRHVWDFRVEKRWAPRAR